MKLLPYILLIAFLCSCTANQEKEAELRTFIKRWDMHFADEWILEKDTIEEIDHFKKGRVLGWAKKENGVKYLRTYVFELGSQFVTAYEQRFINDTLLGQGDIEFKNKEISYIRQVIPNKGSLKKIDSYWEYDVDGYFYEIYNKGKLSCIYRTVHLNHYYMLLDKKNKEIIELVSGKDCLGIKK